GLAGGRALAASQNNFVMLDLQYGAFDLETPRETMLGLIDKAGILKKGTLQPNVIPMARIPVAAHDAPQFGCSQRLAVGVFGIMFPETESREEAAGGVGSMRSPQRNRWAGGPAAARPGMAAWYWGLSEDEYKQRAALWPANPAGEMLAVIQIE